MMNDGFTKGRLSLVLRAVHICFTHPLKAQICVYLMIYGMSHPDFILRKIDFKTYFFHFYFSIQDFSLNIAFIILKVYQHVHNIHLEETVSQFLYTGLSFLFMLKNGKIFIIFS